MCSKAKCSKKKKKASRSAYRRSVRYGAGGKNLALRKRSSHKRRPPTVDLTKGNTRELRNELSQITTRPDSYVDDRGNTAQRARRDYDTFQAVGPRQWNSVKALQHVSPAGYGNRTSDSANSDTGAIAIGATGYRGRLDPVISLMKEAGHQHPSSAASYIANDDVVPSTYSSKDPIGRYGLQPTLGNDTNSHQTAKNWIPPAQDGNMVSKHGPGRFLTGSLRRTQGSSRNLLINPGETNRKINALPNITIDPYTQRTIHQAKFGDDGDPNPIYPLPPTDPTEQQGYRPERLNPREHVVIPAEPFNPGGHVARVGVDEKEEASKVHVPNEKGNESFAQTAEGMLHGAIHNYMNSRLDKASMNAIPTSLEDLRQMPSKMYDEGYDYVSNSAYMQDARRELMRQARKHAISTASKFGKQALRTVMHSAGRGAF